MIKESSLRDTHIDWIPQVPNSWSISRAKYVFRNKSLKNYPNEPLLSVSQRDGLVIRSESDMNVWNPTDDVSGYKLIESGDFVISLRSFEGGLELSKVRGLVSPAYTVLESTRKIDDHYFWWLMKSHQFIIELNKHVTGIRQGKNIGWDDFSNIYLTLPPLEEQNRISRYLDKKTSQIDSLINKVEKKIELLKEQRISLINHYVTKGLDPNVEMKDSGIEWIGDIPTHWKTKKIKYLGSIKSGEGITSSELKEDGEFPVYGGNGIVGFHAKFNLDKKAIIIGRVGEKCGNIHLVNSRAWISDNSLILDLLLGENIEWVSLCLETRDLNKLRNQSSQPLITGTHVKNENIPYPPPNEMKDISEYIQKKSLNIDSAIQKFAKKIELLKEYRQSLISFIVTGKLRVTEEII
jgi:type I restriction enzyme S subunit